MADTDPKVGASDSGLTLVNFKTSPTGAKWISDVAHENWINRSELVRCAMIVAARHKDELVKVIEERR